MFLSIITQTKCCITYFTPTQSFAHVSLLPFNIIQFCKGCNTHFILKSHARVCLGVTLDDCSYEILHYTFHTHSWGWSNIINSYSFKCSNQTSELEWKQCFIFTMAPCLALGKVSACTGAPGDWPLEYDRSPVWKSICTFRWRFLSEYASYTLLLCVWTFILRYCPILNSALYSSPLNVRSRVWMRTCHCRLSLWLNTTSHTLHIWMALHQCECARVSFVSFSPN